MGEGGALPPKQRRSSLSSVGNPAYYEFTRFPLLDFLLRESAGLPKEAPCFYIV